MSADPMDKDDPTEVGRSSDYAQGEPVGRYAGGGPDDSQEPSPKPKGEQPWQSGSRGGPVRDDPNALHQVAGGDGAVRSRSADPPGVGGIAASDAKLGGSLPAGASDAPGSADQDGDTHGAEPGGVTRPDGPSARPVDAEGASERTESPSVRTP